MKPEKNRLDIELVKRKMVSSREKAKALIMAGEVYLKDRIEFKADFKVTGEDIIQIKKRYPFVSRGAYKIEKAFKDFMIDPAGLKVLDIGISSGGFTDYVLQKGAGLVTGVDVNTVQVDAKIRNNPKVILLKKNARFITRDDIGYQPDLILMDVSFISVTKILPALQTFPQARILTLIKPQFEAERTEISRGGVIRNEEMREKILHRLRAKIQNLGYAILGLTNAGLKGRKGNLECFFLLKYGNNRCNNGTIKSR